jgi:hypothetical protein
LLLLLLLLSFFFSFGFFAASFSARRLAASRGRVTFFGTQAYEQ